MENTLSAFAAYFRQLASENIELKSFVFGAADRIISGSRSDITYPCLWLEPPTLELSEKDNTSAPEGQRKAAFVVLLNVDRNDYAAQDAGWELTERLALDVLSRLRRDRQARLFRFFITPGSQLEPVATMTGDNEIGFRFEFELGLPVLLTYDPTRWVAQEGGTDGAH